MTSLVSRYLLVAITFLTLMAVGISLSQVPANTGLRPVLVTSVPFGKSAATTVPSVSSKRLYSITVSSDTATYDAATGARITVNVADSAGVIGGKTLHIGDPDLYVLMRPRKDGILRVNLSPPSQIPPA